MTVTLSPTQRVIRVLPAGLFALVSMVLVIGFHRAGWLLMAPVLAAAAVVGAEMADTTLSALAPAVARLLRWKGRILTALAVLVILTGAATAFRWPDRLIMAAATIAVTAASVALAYHPAANRMATYDNGLPPDFTELYRDMEQIVVVGGLEGLLDEAQQRQASVALNMLWRTVHDAMQARQGRGEYVG
jgi:hypothetical protein